MPIVGGEASGGGSALVEVANYSALPAANTVAGQTYVCLNSQGSRWLFNYYSEGLYYSDGTNWIYRKDPIVATQLEVNTGTNQDKYITPDTFTNASKWSTKADASDIEDLDFMLINTFKSLYNY